MLLRLNAMNKVFSIVLFVELKHNFSNGRIEGIPSRKSLNSLPTRLSDEPEQIRHKLQVKVSKYKSHTRYHPAGCESQVRGNVSDPIPPTTVEAASYFREALRN